MNKFTEEGPRWRTEGLMSLVRQEAGSSESEGKERLQLRSPDWWCILGKQVFRWQ